MIARVVSRERLVAGAVALAVCPRKNVWSLWSNWLPPCKGEVISARTTAAQTQQRATDAETRLLGVKGEGVVDTRLLGKPKSFDGSTDSWRQFKFTFLDYACAVDKTQTGDDRERSACRRQRLGIACQRPASLDTVVLDVSLGLGRFEHAGDGEGLLSWRRLVAEYEPETAGRETSLLLEVLAQTFKRRRARFAEIRSIIMARETLNGPTPMDVSAMYKVKKGKEKSKGKSDDKGRRRTPQRTLTQR